MGKNKRKFQFEKPATTPMKKTHVPTAMELAFREAEDRKAKEIPKANQQLESYSTDSKNVAVQKPVSPAPKIQQITSLKQTKEKPVTSAPVTVPNKKGPVVQQHPVKSKPPRIAPSSPKRTLPSNLGLERVSDKTLTLNTIGLEQGISTSRSERDRPEESVSGKSQVHHGKYKDESDIVMGFDFGTSSSKVIIQDSGRHTAYAVPFGQLSCTGNTYLIPTQLYVGEDGSLSFSKRERDHPCGNIKSYLIDEPDRQIFSANKIAQSITITEVAVGYIAQVIRFSSAWFLKHTESIYKTTHIYWHLNIGMPSRNYDDIQMRKLFQIIALAAWRISMLTPPINIMQVKEYLHEARQYNDANYKGKAVIPEEAQPLWLHPDYINAHPEVIMEVVGYVRSPLRTNGLHLIVDVGATTLDAATFIIHTNEGEDMFPILETAVERLGAMMLHLNRVDAVKTEMEKTLKKIATIDPILPLPDTSHYAISASNAEINKSDEGFFIRCRKMIGQIIKDTKNHRDPNSVVWGNELPVFICGGGGRLPSYLQMIKELGQGCAKSWNVFRGFVIKKIPQPEHLYAPDLPPTEYDRLSVAYGLSFTSDEIGEVIAQSEISDIVKKEKISNTEDRFVSKDMC